MWGNVITPHNCSGSGSLLGSGGRPAGHARRAVPESMRPGGRGVSDLMANPGKSGTEAFTGSGGGRCGGDGGGSGGATSGNGSGIVGGGGSGGSKNGRNNLSSSNTPATLNSAAFVFSGERRFTVSEDECCEAVASCDGRRRSKFLCAINADSGSEQRDEDGRCPNSSVPKKNLLLGASRFTTVGGAADVIGAADGMELADGSNDRSSGSSERGDSGCLTFAEWGSEVGGGGGGGRVGRRRFTAEADGNVGRTVMSGDTEETGGGRLQQHQMVWSGDDELCGATKTTKNNSDADSTVHDRSFPLDRGTTGVARGNQSPQPPPGNKINSACGGGGGGSCSVLELVDVDLCGERTRMNSAEATTNFEGDRTTAGRNAGNSGESSGNARENCVNSGENGHNFKNIFGNTTTDNNIFRTSENIFGCDGTIFGRSDTNICKSVASGSGSGTGGGVDGFNPPAEKTIEWSVSSRRTRTASTAGRRDSSSICVDGAPSTQKKFNFEGRHEQSFAGQRQIDSEGSFGGGDRESGFFLGGVAMRMNQEGEGPKGAEREGSVFDLEVWQVSRGGDGEGNSIFGDSLRRGETEGVFGSNCNSKSSTDDGISNIDGRISLTTSNSSNGASNVESETRADRRGDGNRDNTLSHRNNGGTNGPSVDGSIVSEQSHFLLAPATSRAEAASSGFPVSEGGGNSNVLQQNPSPLFFGVSENNRTNNSDRNVSSNTTRNPEGPAGHAGRNPDDTTQCNTNTTRNNILFGGSHGGNDSQEKPPGFAHSVTVSDATEMSQDLVNDAINTMRQDSQDMGMRDLQMSQEPHMSQERIGDANSEQKCQQMMFMGVPSAGARTPGLSADGDDLRASLPSLTATTSGLARSMSFEDMNFECEINRGNTSNLGGFEDMNSSLALAARATNVGVVDAVRERRMSQDDELFPSCGESRRGDAEVGVGEGGHLTISPGPGFCGRRMSGTEDDFFRPWRQDRVHPTAEQGKQAAGHQSGVVVDKTSSSKINTK